MIDEVWNLLLATSRDLATGRSIADLDVEQTVFQVYLEAVEEEMFLVAVNRLAERRGLEVLRIDVEDGKPSMILSLGATPEDARSRAEVVFVRMQEEELDP